MRLVAGVARSGAASLATEAPAAIPPPKGQAQPDGSDSSVTGFDRRFATILAAVDAVRGTSCELRVAVLEGGFGLTHPLLATKLVSSSALAAGAAASLEPPAGIEAPYHGTFASALAVQGSKRLRLLPLIAWVPRAADREQRASTLTALEAAAAGGAKVVNLSFFVRGGASADACERFMRAHPEMLFVHAAGNEGGELACDTPIEELSAKTFMLSTDNNLAARDIPNLLVVGNATADGGVNRLSNYGRTVGLAARGTDVVSADYPTGFRLGSGTSFAAPAVANAAAKCSLIAPSLAPPELRRVLELTAAPQAAWRGKSRSSGLLDRERAYLLAGALELSRTGLTETNVFAALGATGRELDRLAADIVVWKRYSL